MYGYVYKITLPNTYSYIGSHRSETFDENYWGSSENYKYWKALFLAGKENVKREILCWCMTEQDLIQAEYKAILENNEYLYNLSKEESMAFGDGFNDQDMLKEVNIGVAMGNAVDELKEMASYVTSDIDYDGIYNALIHFNIL